MKLKIKFLIGALVYFFLLNLQFSFAYQEGNISGQITDKNSGDILIGTNIVVEGINLGAISDQNGMYTLNVPQGNYIISVSYIGYEINKREINVSSELLEMNFSLIPKILPGQEVIVTATRAKERETPVAFVNIPRKELIDSYWAQDIPMLISELPGIYAYSDAGNGIGYTYLKIRGFDQKRVSVMINGIPLNDPEDHQVYWVNMPDFLSSVHDIQIQRGVGSSIYGTSSFGGTVNIQTSEMNLPRQIKVSAGTGTYNTKKYSLNLHSGLIDNQYALSARFTKILTDGYRENSAVDMWSYFLSAARYTLNTSTFINIYGGPELTHASWEASPESELRKNHRHNPISYKNTVDNFNQPHYELHHHWQLTDNLNWKNSVYYISGKGYHESFKSNKKLYDFGMIPYYSPDSTYVKRTNLVRQKWVEKNHIGWITSTNWDHNNGTLTLGLDGYIFDSDHWGKVVWAAKLPADTSPENNYYRYVGDKKLITIFAHELYRLTPALTLMADANLQFQKYNLQQKQEGNFKGIDRHAYEVSYNFFNPRIGANYNFTDQWNLFANVSIAHREPSDDDLFDVWQGPDDVGVSPLFAKADTVKKSSGEVDYLNWSKPLTQPEQLLDFELGVGYKSKNLQLKLNGYWMDFKNEIVPYSQVNKDGFPIKGNADYTIHRGIEGSLGLKLTHHLYFSTALAMSQNYFEKFIQYETKYDDYWNFIGSDEIDFNDKTIAGFPGSMANVKLKYSSGPLISYLFLQYIGKQYLDNNEMDERSISAHTLLNFHLSYDFKHIIGLSGVKLSIWINNLLNKTYETAGYWDGENYLWPGAGRNYFLSLETSL